MSKARTAALYKLSRQAMPTKKLVEYLQKKGYSSDDIDAVVEECIRNKWLDDDAWIAMKVKSLLVRHKSRKEMLFYFFRYGFQKEQVEPFLPEDTQEALRTLIEKRYPALLDATADRKAQNKAMNALLRRGFSFDEIMKYKEST